MVISEAEMSTAPVPLKDSDIPEASIARPAVQVFFLNGILDKPGF